VTKDEDNPDRIETDGRFPTASQEVQNVILADLNSLSMERKFLMKKVAVVGCGAYMDRRIRLPGGMGMS
jgi:hypothetical protein